MTLITQTADLAAFCQRQSGAEFVAVDTEFMRDKTYWPQLCLVQVAGPEEAAAIDSLAPDIDLKPLYDLLTDTQDRQGVPRGAAGHGGVLPPDEQAAGADRRHAGRGHGLRLRQLGQL